MVWYPAATKTEFGDKNDMTFKDRFGRGSVAVRFVFG